LGKVSAGMEFSWGWSVLHKKNFTRRNFLGGISIDRKGEFPGLFQKRSEIK